MLNNIKNIITALATIKGLLGLIAPIRDLVIQVETPGASGAQKKQAVLDLSQTVIIGVESAFKIDLPDGFILRCTGSLIDVIVSIENAIGAFKSDKNTGKKTS